MEYCCDQMWIYDIKFENILSEFHGKEMLRFWIVITNRNIPQSYGTFILTDKVRIERVWTPAPKAIDWSFCGRFWIFTYRDSSFCTLLFIFVFSCCWENWCSRWEKSNTPMKHDQSSWSCLKKTLTLCVMAVLK